MHTIFETDSFILKSYPSGEANKILEFFTRDFGLIRASAQGLRQYRSKLRYSLTDFARVRVSLVRGREFWRVTTASKIESTMSDLGDEQARDAMLRIFALLRRFLQGEDPHPELFDLVESAFKALQESVEGAPLHSTIEELTVLRTLFLLGYVRDEPSIHSFIENSSFEQETLTQAHTSRKSIITEINTALKASGL
jgi:DNA repair protein RecO (recombination protein O)